MVGLQSRRLLLGLAAMVAVWSLGVASSVAQTAPVITSAPPALGTVGNGYLHQFQVSPQTPEPTFSVTSGSLPPGVSLSPDGFLTGVPTSAGVFGPTTVCATNSVSPTACQTFTITVLKRSPGLLEAPSPGGPVGTTVRDTVSLVGGYLPTGSVTFRLFSDPACTGEVFSSTNAVDANGTATSDDFTPTQPGTYTWTASYSGDANNNPAASTCAAGNRVTITGGTSTTTPSTSTSTTSPTSTTSTSPTTSTTIMPATTTSAATTTTSTSTSTTSTTTPPTGTTSSTSSSSTTSTSTSTTSTSTSTTTPTSTTAPPAPTTSAPVTTTIAPVTTTTSTTLAPVTTTTPTTVPTTTSTSAPPVTSTTATPATTVTTPTTTTPPAPGPPTIQASPQQVNPGQSVTVAGTGFPPDTPVVAELFSDPVVLGSTATDAAGAFRLVVTVPTTTSPGLHTLRVRTADGTLAAETTLAVTGLTVAAVVSPVVTGGGSLSRTGGDLTGPGRLALGLVVAGFVLVALSWRERSATLPARRPQWPGGRRRWP